MATSFDERAATWDDDPGKVARGRQVADAVRAAVPLHPTTRLLEYGAGTGLAAQALVGDVGPITLVDPSAGMRAVMADKVAAGAFPAGTRIWDLDLSTAPAPDEQFDLVLAVLALHHIVDLDPVLAAFATLLAGGGHLCVADLEEDPHGDFHRSSPDFEGHHGFGHHDLTARLQAAGFADVAFAPCGEVDKDGGTYPMFLATATVRAD